MFWFHLSDVRNGNESKTEAPKVSASKGVKDIRRALPPGRHCPERLLQMVEGLYKRLAGDTARAANVDEVKEHRRGARALKEVVAEQTLVHEA